MTQLDEPRRGVDRRTILKGAAWSVPVIAAAVVTPLAAASPAEDARLAGNVTVTGGCLPIFGTLVGGHTITNANNEPVTISIVQTISSRTISGVGTGAGVNWFKGNWGWSGSGEPSSWSDNVCSDPADPIWPFPSAGPRYCESSRTWTTTIPANSSVTISKGFPLTLTGDLRSNLAVSVGTAPVQGLPGTYAPVLLGALCS